ncbi:MAG: hypothetical protein HY318_14560 [Armatimonadetes bacterium]|nr:hypothetical protein [Armatimonadota bacterium]
MWEEQDQARWNELSRKRDGGTLGVAELAEYDELVIRLETEEWERLRPTLRSLHRETLIMKEARQAAERELGQLDLLLAERRTAKGRKGDGELG